ncbi:methylesterase 1-like [Zingiber officinale]|uniref:methylesterase 1-like n=1 Tax=Zingiber officinale TaxID=94328 RepID=UPI001C4B5184|nr:methylesterase 1-like [Zingiber officinale]
MADSSCDSSHHIVLVHGACHGAWSWYKLISLLRSAGHRVTALDLAASGVDERRFSDLRNFADYNQPLIDLLAALPQGERIVLVGHSLGGLNIAFAMDRFPHKVAVGVFVTAFLPDTVHPPSFVYNKVQLEDPTLPFWLDTQFGTVGDKENGPLSMLFGPKFVSLLYNRSPPEDSALAMKLVRPSSLFAKELESSSSLSASGYGSVAKVYVVCEKDEALQANFQRWMIENYPVNEVRVIEEADHMPMLSTPAKLSQYISEIADKNASFE